MKIILCCCLGVVLFVCITAGQCPTPVAGSNDDSLVLLGRVLDSTENDCESEVCGRIFTYEVLRVVSGRYSEWSIRVLQGVGVSKDMRIGDELCLTLQKTDVLRNQADDARYFGLEYPESLIADYQLSAKPRLSTCYE
jgi:hypothetical protein